MIKKLQKARVPEQKGNQWLGVTETRKGCGMEEKGEEKEKNHGVY